MADNDLAPGSEDNIDNYCFGEGTGMRLALFLTFYSLPTLSSRLTAANTHLKKRKKKKYKLLSTVVVGLK